MLCGCECMGYHLNELDETTKSKLKELGKAKYGTSTISKVITHLINEAINDESTNPLIEPLEIDKSIINEDRKKIYATIFISQYQMLLRICEDKKMSPNYFFKSCLLRAIGKQYIINGDELEELRKSNYLLSKIGTNINQIAKRINTMDSYNFDDITDLNKLTSYLDEHLKVVKIILERTQDKW